MKDDILFSENWLLAYEGIKKGWLTPVAPNLLEDNLFFKLLKDSNIEFYNTTNQLNPYQGKGQNNQTITPPITYEGFAADIANSENNDIPIISETPVGYQPEFIETIPSGFDF